MAAALGPASRTTSLDTTVDVETPEHVVFSYTLAGVGSRGAAAALDYFCCFTLLMVTIFAGAALPGVDVRAGDASTPWVVAIVLFLQFAIIWGYYVLFEGLNDGQTPGKARLGLRVVQDGGYAVSFGASAVRNLARVIDMQPGFTYAVGLISMSANKSGKRLGDLIAGTIVVREDLARAGVRTRGPAAPVTSPGTAAPLHTLLTDDEFAVLARYHERRSTLDDAQRSRIAAQLAARFRSRATEFDGADAALLARLFEHESAARARGIAARSDTGAAREQHAIVAAGLARWSAFATRLSDVKRRGLAKLPEAELSDFVADYRELSTDLARLQTASRGREVDAVFTLSRLVAAGHNLLYRQRDLTLRTAFAYLTVTVPREIRRSARPILLAALMLFGPATVAWVSIVRDPDTASEFLPPAAIDRATDGVRRAARGEGYITDPQLWRPTLASRIVTNNIQVTFLAFAAGLMAGLGTLLVLVFNGAFLGGMMGLYHSKGILNLILAFVAPHGVLELTAICLAGGAGLLIGAGMLLPGTRTRREALVINSRRAIRLIAGSAVLLVIAGAIEGFVSPIEWWPLAWKLTVSAVTAVFLAGYLMLGRGAEAGAPDEQMGYAARAPRAL